MQIALVAVVLLAGMWFTVLKPKPDAGVATPATAAPAAGTASSPVAPGVNGLARAVDKAKAAAASTSAAAKPTAAKAVAPAKGATTKTTKSVAAARKPGTKAAKPAAPATAVDPSDRLLAYLAKGKTLVILFHGDGADDAAARKAVHRTALKDEKMVSAYVPISKVGSYEAITSGVDVLTAPTVMVIGTDHKATSLTGFIEAATVKQAVGDARRAAASAKK